MSLVCVVQMLPKAAGEIPSDRDDVVAVLVVGGRGYAWLVSVELCGKAVDRVVVVG